MKLSPLSLAAAVVLGLAAAPALPAAAQPAPPPSAADFAKIPALDQVSISPDGKHIAALTSPDGKTVHVSVWRTDALSEPPQVIGSNRHIRYIGVSFLKNDRLSVTAIQTFTVGEQHTHLTKQYVTDFSGKEWRSLIPAGRSRSEYEAFVNSIYDADILSRLPNDPQHVLAVDNRLAAAGDIFKVNVYTGQAIRTERGSTKFGFPQPDLKGEIRAKQEYGYDDGKIYGAQWIKHPDTGAWEEHFRWYAKDREPIEVVGFDTDPNIVILRSAVGRDKAGLYTYDIRARKIIEPLFEHKLFEAVGLFRAKDGRIIGLTYAGETGAVFWTDQKLASLNKGVRAALGVKTVPVDWTDIADGSRTRITTADGADVDIISVSDSLDTMIVKSSGPKQPDVFYLLRSDGTLTQLGASRPWLNTAALGDTRLVQYAARDGLMIPAFLTTPRADIHGPGPYPTLIEPHGGPWSRDDMDWDVTGWTQYFAARGYAVLQPQFRGSQGWGQKLWRAGDGEWGQKMQDDKDDGAKWLIDQKIAAPDRIAMFGYSYGGYAALAAAIRPNGLYQCAISGAGAGDLAAISRSTFDNRFLREFQHPTIKGLDALEKAREASIPVLLYHGDRDTIVEIEQSEDFAARLKSAGKPYKLIEIKDMGHGYITWTPEMTAQQLTDVEAYLKADCGPGGL